ncbi:mismatch-specific DNA-glycosylase [Nakamurella sp. YIM 132084]|uniref:Mismatch-specific DNA-glycosylase n=1 Tax=Nakamurella leprariae TaxID=2803911 RepID=A0A939C0Q0_9ACTN|nr:mismatch-specific DNA-glycosylase [Nakamurella leprariae]
MRSARTGFTRDELLRFHGARVDDLIGPGLRLLFVGINPGLWTAAVNAHFARPGNRFWPALAAAGITPHQVDARAGLSDADRAVLADRGIGITNLVPMATATSAELTAAQLRAGGERLRRTVAEHRPAVVAVLGVTAYRAAFGRRDAEVGRQTDAAPELGDTPLWVLPNPSGLNAHETVASLAAAYREVAVVAGVPVGPVVAARTPAAEQGASGTL